MHCSPKVMLLFSLPYTHPLLRSVIRRQLDESKPTRPLRTTEQSKGRSSGEIRLNATSGERLFIFQTLPLSM